MTQTQATRAKIESIAPFFLVSNVPQTIAFYRDKLGFEVMHQHPESNPFFAIISRDGSMIFIKSDSNTPPLPNSLRNHEIKWDTYLYVPAPEALAAEFTSANVIFHKPLGITTENLLGFELADPDGYILFFGRPN